MKALIFERNGEPSEVLSLHKIEAPRPGPGEVLVRVLIASVNPSDLHIIRGRFGRQPSLPASPGTECVGIVEAHGEGVTAPAIGTRVVLLNAWGTWREKIVAAAERAIPVPDAVSDEDAAQAMINPVTAWVLTMVEHRMKPGEWLAQSAAGSTVGRLVVQIGKFEGFRTVNLVRRAAQVDEIIAAGGDAVICTDDADWAAQLATAADGSAPAKGIDCVAGRTGAAMSRALGAEGRLLVYGALSSHRQADPSAFQIPVFAPRLIYDSGMVQGWFLFRWLDQASVEESSAILRKILELLASGLLKLPASRRYPLSAIQTALTAAEGARDAKPLLDFSS